MAASPALASDAAARWTAFLAANAGVATSAARPSTVNMTLEFMVVLIRTVSPCRAIYTALRSAPSPDQWMSRHKIVKLFNNLIRFLCPSAGLVGEFLFAAQQSPRDAPASRGIISEIHGHARRRRRPLPREAA
jgi:hypothetical protein